MKTAKNQNPIVHCIGDSHANYFTGMDVMQVPWPARTVNLFPFFKACRLGPVLAYSLHKPNTSNRGREKLFAIVGSIPKEDYIMFCFGEIDCRAHILKQAKLQNVSIEKIIDNFVDKYLEVIFEIKNKGYNVLIWNIIPSSPENEINNEEYPIVGTCQDRNHITMIINESLKKRAAERAVLFISIFDYLVDANNLTKREYLFDLIHLNQKSMDFTINSLNQKLNTKYKKPFLLLFKKILYTFVIKLFKKIKRMNLFKSFARKFTKKQSLSVFQEK